MRVNENVTLLSLYPFEKPAKICENSQKLGNQKDRKIPENKGFSSVLRRRGNNRSNVSQAEEAGSIPVSCSKKKRQPKGCLFSFCLSKKPFRQAEADISAFCRNVCLQSENSGRCMRSTERRIVGIPRAAKARYFKNSFGSMALPSLVTEKCRCGALEDSISEVVPTEPMTCPAETYCPSPTVGTLCRFA